jgi:hypothetical protein
MRFLDMLLSQRQKETADIIFVQQDLVAVRFSTTKVGNLHAPQNFNAIGKMSNMGCRC